MRRKDREVTDFAAIQQIVADCGVLRLGINDGGYPYVVPVNFGYEWQGTELVLYIHGARQGHKLSLLAEDGRVGIEMDTDHGTIIEEKGDHRNYSFSYRSLMGRGEAILLTDPQEKLAALMRIVAHYTEGPEPPINEKAAAATAVVAIRVQDYTAKMRGKVT